MRLKAKHANAISRLPLITGNDLNKITLIIEETDIIGMYLWFWCGDTKLFTIVWVVQIQKMKLQYKILGKEKTKENKKLGE